MRAFIKDLKAGKLVNEVFLLKTKQIGKTKDNKPYLRLAFADKTGTIEGRLWDDAEEIEKRVDTGDFVFIMGSVDEWKGNMQIKVEDMRRAMPDEFNAADLIRCVENINELFEEFKECIYRNVTSRWVLLLVNSLIDNEDFILRFKKAAGARSWHNAYTGGLLEHTYEVMVIVEKMCDLYREANREIAIAGAFLHDIGKVFELDSTTFEYTKEGNLLGHLSMGFEIVSREIRNIKGFPQDIALHIEHIILSHHGEYEQQSPVLPKTLEAIIVYHADELVSQANAVKEIMKTQSYGDREWSNFVGIKNRKFFLQRVKEENLSS